MNVHSSWLTVNRACNLSCKWCYAKNESKYNQMNYELAKKLIDICVDNGVGNFILIGGEPTIYPHFFDIIDYLFFKSVSVTVVTNGIVLAQDDFCKLMRNYNNKKKIHFGISLKGADDETYLNDCGYAAFNDVIQGIRNCDFFGLNYSLSYVISNENVNQIDLFCKKIRQTGIEKPIFFVYCNDVIGSVNLNPLPEIDTDYKLAQKYDEISRILDDKLKLHQSFPLCMCDKNMYEKMREKRQLITTCHVYNRKGIIFDTDGSILLCNHLAGYGLGKFGIDFTDSKSLDKFWNSEYILDLYKKFTSVPDEKCISCDKYSECGGGCNIQWFTQHFSKYKEYVKKKEDIL